MITNQLTPQSPFESIRHFDRHGNEFWLATQLLSLLGYKSLKRILDTVDRARTSCQNSGGDSTEHFDNVVQIQQIGDMGGSKEVVRDCRLSRYACYLVAMNGDPRKPEIASAQSYFAVKTREAETVIPVMSETIRQLELQNEILDKQLRMRELDNSMTIMHGKEYVLTLRGKEDQLVETEVKTVEVIDERHNVRWEGQTMTQFKEACNKRLGTNFKTGSEIKRILDKHGLVAQVPRTIPQDYIPKELIDEAYKVIKSKLSQSRQLLLGE